jgi:hypothetical protein
MPAHSSKGMATAGDTTASEEEGVAIRFVGCGRQARRQERREGAGQAETRQRLRTPQHDRREKAPARSVRRHTALLFTHLVRLIAVAQGNMCELCVCVRTNCERKERERWRKIRETIFFSLFHRF